MSGLKKTPWQFLEDDSQNTHRICNSAGKRILTLHGHDAVARKNAAIIIAAVNAYDPEREAKVQALVEAAKQMATIDVTIQRPDVFAVWIGQEHLRRALAALNTEDK